MNPLPLIATLRELHEAATPLPWFTLDPPWLPSGTETSILAESPDPHVARFICDFDLWALDDECDADRKSECPDADAALIVALRNAVPGLLDLIDRQAAEIAELREGFERLQNRAALYASNYLADERADPANCWDAEHHSAVVELCQAVDDAVHVLRARTALEPKP